MLFEWEKNHCGIQINQFFNDFINITIYDKKEYK